MALPAGFELTEPEGKKTGLPAGFELVETQEPTYLETVKNRLSTIVDPEAWKQAGQDLLNFPPVTPETMGQLENVAKDVAIMSPTSVASKAARLFNAPTPKPGDIAKQKVLKETGDAGYYLPTSNIKASVGTNLVERFGGKQAIEHTARMKNQPITNAKAARALGLSDDVPITPELLSTVRAEAGKAYDTIKNVGTLTADNIYNKSLSRIADKYSGASKDFPELTSKAVSKLVKAMRKKTISAEGAVEQIKNLRDSAKTNIAGHMATVETKLLGKAQRKAAEALENLLEKNIGPKLGKKTLGNFRKAREIIAKTYTVENALKGANVDAAMLAKDLQKGKPLSGLLKDIAKFSQNFPGSAKIPQGQAASGGSLEPLLYGAAGVASTGPMGAAAALGPIVGKPIARHLATKIPRQHGKNGLQNALGNVIVQKPLIGAGVIYDRDNRQNNRNSRRR